MFRYLQEEDQEVLAAVTAGSGIPPEEAAWWNADPEVDLPGLPISGAPPTCTLVSIFSI